MTIGDLHEGLERILKDAEAINGGADSNAEDLGRMARYVAEIRSALTELNELTAGPGRSTEQAAVLSSLASRFWTLEGRVKELRNDSESRGEKKGKQWASF
ncbi:MAG: hypothetical protein A2010_10365 [Nitrospirae bacterium GWD2_57_9]|nr:MAG: hypothetical protein A2010_10365 [Nitrospirae bacterium GWD2_57_9]